MKRRSNRDTEAFIRDACSFPLGCLALQGAARERDKEEWRSRRFRLLAMDAYSQYKALVNQYLLATGQGIEHVQCSTENDHNDYSVLREQHKFLWEPDVRPLFGAY